MSRRPWLYAYVNDETGLALVRGRDARNVVRMFEPEASDKRRHVWRAKWSTQARGWVIPAGVVADLVAYGEHRHTYVVVSSKDPVPVRRAA